MWSQLINANSTIDHNTMVLPAMHFCDIVAMKNNNKGSQGFRLDPMLHYVTCQKRGSLELRLAKAKMDTQPGIEASQGHLYN